jgi:hypothetical protein
MIRDKQEMVLQVKMLTGQENFIKVLEVNNLKRLGSRDDRR